MNTPNPNLTTADVLDALRTSGKPLREWGRAVDGTPLLAARIGGSKQPAIFITAGSHAPETAGVHAALNLLRELETEHETHILPLRDPLGFSGVNGCLSFAMGQRVALSTYDDALDFLQARGELSWREGDLHVFKLGELGFAWDTPQPGAESMMSMNARILSQNRSDPDTFKPLWGKRIMVMCASVGVEGTGEMGRCWHGVMSASGEPCAPLAESERDARPAACVAQGEWMHLNRFFGRSDAPAEVVAVDQLMQMIRPGLTCDLHEGNGKGFWMPMRKQSNPALVFDMTKAYLDYINTQGYPITTYDDWVATDRNVGKNYPPTWMQPEPRLPGLFWADGTQRNEGYNLIDYSCLFGIGYGTEAPLARPLAERVDGITNGIMAAIDMWERSVVTT